MTPSLIPETQLFQHLKEHDAQLCHIAALAEQMIHVDPNTSILKIRQFGELMTLLIMKQFNVSLIPKEPQIDKIDRLYKKANLSYEVCKLLHKIRMIGNDANHDLSGSTDEAMVALRCAYDLGVWYHRTFGDEQFNPPPFVKPTKSIYSASDIQIIQLQSKAFIKSLEAGFAHDTEALQKEITQQTLQSQQLLTQLQQTQTQSVDIQAQLIEEKNALLAHIQQLQTELAAQASQTPNSDEVAARLLRAARAAERIPITEADARAIIDEQLRAAGWETDSQTLRYNLGTRPELGRNMAISEWPVEQGRADYVLFIGLTPVAVIEAKRPDIGAVSGMDQALRYCQDFAAQDVTLALGAPWGPEKYQIPFAFSSNGRSHIPEIESQSGIFFRDLRDSFAHRRPLYGWYSPEGLTRLLSQDYPKALDHLHHDPVSPDLNLRSYQVKAVQAVEDTLRKRQRRAMIAMATGTGKTRTCLGLMYRLMRSDVARRILFLVDRNALAEQAHQAFTSARIEGSSTLPNLYTLSIDSDPPTADRFVHITTVQSLLRRIDNDQPLPIDTYDFLIIDECHRGYNLNRQQSEDLSSIRDDQLYISQYRRVIEHFDAPRIGLTATPALHTVNIFGPPVFTYGYRDAVLDGVLVDHEPPFSIVTELGQAGIHFSKGEEVKVISPDPNSTSVTMPDDISFDVEEFNRQVLVPSFNRAIAASLAPQFLNDPRYPGKILIFCVNNSHADDVVAAFREQLAFASPSPIPEQYVVKITSIVDQPDELIRRFRNESLPRVVVTVDLLTTGIDVPPIDTIVFLRAVRSRILFEQMLGRATRRYDDNNKETFRIFDAARVCERMVSLNATQMRPIVQRPTLNFRMLLDDLASAQGNDTAQQSIRDEIIGRLTRKLRRVRPEDRENMNALADIDPTADLPKTLRALSPSELSSWFKSHASLVDALDQLLSPSKGILVYGGSDVVIAVNQSQPLNFDYLSEFTDFLRGNLNTIPALFAITQRPRDLTAKSLRDLARILQEKRFTETNIKLAWQNSNQTDIAAGLVGFIRRAILGDNEPLLPYAERVDAAIQRIIASRSWTNDQIRWLQQMGVQMKAQPLGIMAPEDFDQGAFRSGGGWRRLNKVFDDRLPDILGDLQEEIWKRPA